MQAELTALEKALGHPERPVLAVVGGAKVSTKLDLLGNLTAKVDMLVIGGGMANTFLAAQGIDVAASLCEHDLGDTARDILARAEAAGCEVILPTDVVVAKEFAANAENSTVPATEVPAGTMILDAGPDSVARVIAAIDKAKTLIWNGPLGAFEIEPFDAATNAAAEHAAARSAAGDLISVAGGGDTVAALNRAGAADASPISRPPAARSWNGWRARPCRGSRRWTRVEARRTHCLRHHNGQGPALRLKLSPTVFRPKTFEDR
jgi:phosphoglycerate kinase